MLLLSSYNPEILQLNKSQNKSHLGNLKFQPRPPSLMLAVNQTKLNELKKVVT